MIKEGSYQLDYDSGCIYVLFSPDRPEQFFCVSILTRTLDLLSARIRVNYVFVTRLHLRLRRPLHTHHGHQRQSHLSHLRAGPWLSGAPEPQRHTAVHRLCRTTHPQHSQIEARQAAVDAPTSAASRQRHRYSIITTLHRCRIDTVIKRELAGERWTLAGGYLHRGNVASLWHPMATQITLRKKPSK